MLTTSQLTRIAATTALIATLGTTSVAIARPDSALRAQPSTTSTPGAHWTVPRTEGMGVQPIRPATTVESTPPVSPTRVDAGAAAVPLIRDDDASGTDWLPFAAGAGVLTLLAALAIAALRNHRSLGHPFRTPRI